MSTQKPYDLLVIGGGPAGLSAACGVSRQGHATLLFDSGSYRNDGADAMHAVSTWDHKPPSEYRAAARNDYKRYGCVEIENAEVKSIKKNADSVFEATTSNGKTYTGHKVVLATGVEDVYPDIPGYAECWVKGM